MTKEEIVAQIQSNIDAIEIGMTFPTKTALYNTLGFNGDEKDNKKIERYVSAFLTYEKVNKQNSREGKSNEIKITGIVDDAYDFVPTDGRRSNGGARYQYSDKLASQISSALGTGGDYSYKRLFKQFYRFDIDANVLSLKCDSMYVHRYTDIVYDTLRNGTLTVAAEACCRKIDGAVCRLTPESFVVR